MRKLPNVNLTTEKNPVIQLTGFLFTAMYFNKVHDFVFLQKKPFPLEIVSKQVFT